jgi:hypothetical protein
MTTATYIRITAALVASLLCSVAHGASTTFLSSDSGGHTIEDEGTARTQRDVLNFTGAGVECTDVGGETTCNITGGSATAIADISDTTITTPSDADLLCFTGAVNASLNCTVAGDISAAEAAGVLTLTIEDSVTVDLWTLGNPTLTGIGVLPFAADPLTDANGEFAIDQGAWGGFRDAVEVFDGTASTRLIGTLASSTPSNGQVPKYVSASGTITWQDDTAGSAEWTETAGKLHPQTATDDVCDDASCTDWQITPAGAATFASVTIPATAAGGHLELIEATGGTGSNTWRIDLSTQDLGANFTVTPCEGAEAECGAAGQLAPSDLLQHVRKSMYWGAGAMSADGVNCADPAEVTINSGPKLYSAICTDNAASILYGSTVLPDGFTGTTVTFELSYVQTAAETLLLNSDISAMCRSVTDTINSTWGSPIAMDENVTGTNGLDLLTSAAVTPNGTCAGGDMLYWRWVVSTDTTTTMSSLHILGMKMEYLWAHGD